MRLSHLGVAGVTLAVLAIQPLGGGVAYAAERSAWYMGVGAGRTTWSVNSRRISAILDSRTDGQIGRIDSTDSAAGV